MDADPSFVQGIRKAEIAAGRAEQQPLLFLSHCTAKDHELRRDEMNWWL